MIQSKKIITLFFAFISVVSLVAINGVKSQSAGTIFINADGTVSGTDAIQRSGNVYALTENIYDSPIVVLCNDIILDGEGFALQGPGGWPTPAAINLTCMYVAVQNFVITGWEVGILGVYNSNTISDNNVTNNERDIAIYADNYFVTGNYIAQSDYSVRIIGNNNRP